eukprot:scaffold213037_cov32-Tisochrysis_lutea.AAC.1
MGCHTQTCAPGAACPRHGASRKSRQRAGDQRHRAHPTDDSASRLLPRPQPLALAPAAYLWPRPSSDRRRWVSAPYPTLGVPS